MPCIPDMRIIEEKNSVIAELEGRIDTLNSASLEEELSQVVSSHPGKALILDASGLTYISSMGLRVLHRLRKNLGDRFSVRNTSPEIYEIFRMTGMVELFKVTRKMRRISVEGCPVIGEGAFGTVYRLDAETIVKVYRNGEDSLPVIEKEHRKAREAFVSGVPTAIPFDTVKVGDQYGMVFEMLDARNCNDVIASDPSSMETILELYASFLKKIHSLRLRSGQIVSAGKTYMDKLDLFSRLLKEETLRKVRSLIQAMPEDLHLVHGDPQLKNIMLTGNNLMAIDMDHMIAGDPVFDFAALNVTYNLYGEDNPLDSMTFLHLERKTTLHILERTLDLYLGKTDALEKERILDRIALVSRLDFLSDMFNDKKDDRSPLRDLRIRHSLEEVERLAYKVDDLRLMIG